MSRYLGIFLILISMGACAQSESSEATTQLNLDVQQVSELVKANTEVVLIDVRTPDEYAKGHLEGSNLINFYDPKFKEKVDELDKDVEYVVYCRSGGRSANAVELMQGLGFTKIHNMKGGILAWNRAGLPTQE